MRGYANVKMRGEVEQQKGMSWKSALELVVAWAVDWVALGAACARDCLAFDTCRECCPRHHHESQKSAALLPNSVDDAQGL